MENSILLISQPALSQAVFSGTGLVVTHWPLNTNRPESFARLERKWNKYFLPEPGLHLGYTF